MRLHIVDSALRSPQHGDILSMILHDVGGGFDPFVLDVLIRFVYMRLKVIKCTSTSLSSTSGEIKTKGLGQVVSSSKTTFVTFTVGKVPLLPFSSFPHLSP